MTGKGDSTALMVAIRNEEVDAIHERYRNPSAAYANKELVQTAPWLEDAMRPKEEL